SEAEALVFGGGFVARGLVLGRGGCGVGHGLRSVSAGCDAPCARSRVSGCSMLHCDGARLACICIRSGRDRGVGNRMPRALPPLDRDASAPTRSFATRDVCPFWGTEAVS